MTAGLGVPQARVLGLGGERDWLDYKSQCDLSSMRDLAEITKDIGAMMITGGYVIVGADDQGRPSGEVARQIAYQHAHHLGLPVDEISPSERRQRYEAAVKAAQSELSDGKTGLLARRGAH